MYGTNKQKHKKESTGGRITMAIEYIRPNDNNIKSDNTAGVLANRITNLLKEIKDIKKEKKIIIAREAYYRNLAVSLHKRIVELKREKKQNA